MKRCSPWLNQCAAACVPSAAQVEADIVSFMLVRGDYAWLGYRCAAAAGCLLLLLLLLCTAFVLAHYICCRIMAQLVGLYERCDARVRERTLHVAIGDPAAVG